MTSVRDEPVRILVKRPAVKVHREDTLRQLAETFTGDSIGAAVVRDTDPPAIVSERDVVNALADGADPDQERAEGVMTEELAWVGPEDSVAQATRLMLDNEIRHLPVIDDGVVIGVVSARDALSALATDVQRD